MIHIQEEEGSSGNTDVSSSQQTSASGDEDKTGELRRSVEKILSLVVSYVT